MQLILQANEIQKQYGIRTVLDFDSFQVYEGDRIGVVGANGAGKSTLLGILSGEIEPDRGTVTRTCHTAFIRQFAENDSRLSGGENVKRRIQRELERENTIVFADEPTANLDREGIRWLRTRLLAAGTVLLISHDRELLDQVCNRIVEVKDGALHSYTGNYTDYRRFMAEAEARQRQEYQEYRRTKAGLEQAIRVREQNVSRQKSNKKKGLMKNSSENRLRGDKRAAIIKKVERGAKVLENRLDRLEQVEKQRTPPEIRMDFSKTSPPGGKLVLQAQDLHFAYGERVIFRGAKFAVPNRAKVAVTGPNGAGKTTLLRLIYEGNEAVNAAPSLRLGYLHQGFEDLDPEKTVLDNVLATSVQDRGAVRSILAGLLFFGDDVFKPAAVLSGGEKIRLSLARLIASGANALLLDEPTNYLDIPSIEAVEGMIRQYPGTVLVVSHDARFLDAVTDRELVVGEGDIREKTRRETPPPQKPADRLVLELRRTKLVSAINSAPPEEKTLLEAEYAQVLEQLRCAGE